MKSCRNYNGGCSSIILALVITACAPGLCALLGNKPDSPRVFSGTLYDDAGKGVAGAIITASNQGGLTCGMTQKRTAEAATDEHGHFTLQTDFYPVWLNVRSEVGTMSYAHNNYYFGRPIPVALLRQGEHNLVLIRWAQVRGQVLDRKTSEPVREFRVHFHASLTHTPRKYESKDGHFVEARVTPGMNTITIMAKGYAPTILHAVPVLPGSTVDIGQVQMNTGPTVTGRVISERSGRPLVGAVIRFRDARTHAVVSYPPDELTATTDAEGQFSVANMPLLALEVYTSIDTPKHRSFTLGTVDMSLAQNGTVDALFFVDVED